MEEEITERYNRTTGLIEIRCGRCANAEDIPTRKREKHEYGLFLPEWKEARPPSRFSRGSNGDCTYRGQVAWSEMTCSECGNLNINDG